MSATSSCHHGPHLAKTAGFTVDSGQSVPLDDISSIPCTRSSLQAGPKPANVDWSNTRGNFKYEFTAWITPLSSDRILFYCGVLEWCVKQAISESKHWHGTQTFRRKIESHHLKPTLSCWDQQGGTVRFIYRLGLEGSVL